MKAQSNRHAETVLFAPGFQEDMDSRDYAAVLKIIEDKGYKAQFVPIDWQRKTINQWVAQFEAAYHQHDPERTILAGFSFGAMTAFVAAARRNPAALWLCSLSPYFAEDMRTKDQAGSWMEFIGPRRAEAFKRLQFDTLAAQIVCRSMLFVGEKEWPGTRERAGLAHTALVDSRMEVVPDVAHDITAPPYMNAIARAI